VAGKDVPEKVRKDYPRLDEAVAALRAARQGQPEAGGQARKAWSYLEEGER
jgi:hypothetical protein